jgi:hypothetical protein
MAKHILAAWELGGGYGHIGRLCPVSERLAAMGRGVTYALANPAALTSILGETRHRVLVAPNYAGVGIEGLLPASFPELLLGCGYATTQVLTALIAAWLDIIADVRPDLIVTDFAPTALLAARIAGVPSANLGCGWSTPPPVTPMPSLRPWDDVPADRLMASEGRVLGTINAALVSFGTPPLRDFADLLRDCSTFVCTFPELDHYENRGTADYYGPIYLPSAGVEPDWPAAAGPRVFAYVNAGHAPFHGLLTALGSLGVPTVLHARNAPIGPMAPNIRPMSRPIRLAEALASCDLVITQGINTITAALLAGRPVICLPEHLEQTATAARIIRQGFGLAIAPESGAGEMVRVLRRVMDDPGFATRAHGFANHYHGYGVEMTLDAIVEECDAVLS